MHVVFYYLGEVKYSVSAKICHTSKFSLSFTFFDALLVLEKFVDKVNLYDKTLQKK